MKKNMLLFVALSILFYLSFSFTLWEMNPRVWGEEKRGSFIVFLFLTLIVTPFIMLMSKDNDLK
jgi:hypothetical protein